MEALKAAARQRLAGGQAELDLGLEAPGRRGRPALAGGFGLPDALTVPDRVEESFRQRSESLTTATRLLLLTAAADPTGDTALLMRATAHLGIGVDAAAPAEEAGLLELLRDALTGRWDTYLRFVGLVVIIGGLVIFAHLAGVPMPWGS